MENENVPFPIGRDGEPLRLGDGVETTDGIVGKVVGVARDLVFVDDGDRYGKWSADSVRHVDDAAENDSLKGAEDVADTVGDHGERMADGSARSTAGYVKLPVDRYGKPWRFGDLCEVNGKVKRLNTMHLYANGNGKLCFGGSNDCVHVDRGRTAEAHRVLTPAERVRRLASEIEFEAGTERRWARFQGELLDIAGELEASERGPE